MQSAAVVSGCDAAEVFELVDATFDAVAQFVEPPIERIRLIASGVRGDYRLGADGFHRLPERIAVVGGVGDHGLRLRAFYQAWRENDVVDLPGGERKTQRPPEGVDEQVDFGRQSSSRTPQSLIAGPPFPVAAC